MANENYILNAGRNLVSSIPPPKSKQEKKFAYSLSEARQALLPMARAAAVEINALPEGACPADQAVGVITLHPQALAKSYYPKKLIRAAGLRTVGSRPKAVKPRKWTKKSEPVFSPSTELFVAGERAMFQNLAESLGQAVADMSTAEDVRRIESFRAFGVEERLRSLPDEAEELMLDVALHADESAAGQVIFDSFIAFARLLGAKPDIDRRLFAGGLCFLPLRADRSIIRHVAQHSFLRVVRPMAGLRPVCPISPLRSAPAKFKPVLPDTDAIDPSIRLAIFDGGVPDAGVLGRWVTSQDVGGIGETLAEFSAHGCQVTSAALFGHLVEGEPAPRPFGVVDHYRVLDKAAARDPDNLYDVIARIKAVLESKRYEFVNLSIGPDRVRDDDDVHVWTSVLDELLAHGETLATVAVGNDGEADAASGMNRIQVPSDAVNGLSVGAADSLGETWGRAHYSSVGPGRSPGLVKPELVGFGGGSGEPFWAIQDPSAGIARPTLGTSFASPATNRMAMGVRAHLGKVLKPMALKALLINSAQTRKDDDLTDVGWGRVPADLESIVVCEPTVAWVVYQGTLQAREFIRVRVPVPDDLKGYVYIKATFCYATAVDSNHSGNYTRAGLDVKFRPHDEKFKQYGDGSLASDPKTASFFQMKDFSTEEELRHNAHWWETTLHRERRKLPSSLRNPVFDVHYNAREKSQDGGVGSKLRYALVISVRCDNVPDVYERMVRQFGTLIRPMQPVIQIPIRATP